MDATRRARSGHALRCSAAFLICTLGLPAQTVGGGYGTLITLEGLASGDGFGGAVASLGDVDGDGIPDLLIGAKGASSGIVQDSGAVSLHSGADGAVLKQWFGTAPMDAFGAAVASAGDLDGDGLQDALIGAYGAGPLEAGACYAYSSATGQLLFEVHGWQADQRFGEAVAGAGDVDADGVPDLLFGAGSTDFQGHARTGAVAVVSGLDGSLLHLWHGLHAHDQFGSAVAAIGDLNLDGHADLLIGALGTDPHGRSDAGTVYVLSGTDGTRLGQWSGFAIGGAFGGALAGLEDVDADGVPDIMVGAYLALSEAGQAYVFSGGSGAMLHSWEGSHVGIRLGSAVAPAGDLDGDGTQDFLLGADHDQSTAGLRAGSCSAYSGIDGSWMHTWFGEEASGELGSAMAYAGDLDGDGRGEVLVGAPLGAGFHGSAAVFSFDPYLQASTDTVSASAGGDVSLTLDFPDPVALQAYRILFSASGTGPTHLGVDLPLSDDALLRNTAAGAYPFPTSAGLQGTLDPSGDALAGFRLPSGAAAGLIGRVFQMAAVAHPPGLLPEVASVALPLAITP